MRATEPNVSKRVVQTTLLTVAALLLLGGAWNSAANNQLRRLHPLPGSELQVDGRSMHIDCTGEGSPTLVLESGLGDPWWTWQKVQPQLSRITRVCSYDRAGIGGSASQSGPRDAIRIAEQLHTLLAEAGVNAPIVLVGHSAGGLYARAFNGLYPEMVSGIVFVDAASPEMFGVLPGAREDVHEREKRHRAAWMDWWSALVGWKRITGGCYGNTPSGLEGFDVYDEIATCKPSAAVGGLGESDDFELSGREVSAMPCCSNVPILIISQDPGRPKQGWDAQSIAANPIWAFLQERLKTLSPRSRRIVARTAGHHIMIDRPDVLIRNISAFVLAIRNGTASNSPETTIQ